MKQCNKCHQLKPFSEFHKNKTKPDGHGYMCKSCRREYHAKHYKANSQAYIEKNKARRSALIDTIRELKNQPCADCQQLYPHYVMQFDHLPNFEKNENVCILMYKGAAKKIKEEIKKCELVCANCHAARTWHRLQAKKRNEEVESSP